MKRIKRTPTYTRDHDSREIVRVPLCNSKHAARILAVDFDRLRTTGVSDQWTLNGVGEYQYVRCPVSENVGDLDTVARLILHAPPGRIVKYRDGNRLNLRRDNLVLVPGYAPGVTAKDTAERAAA